MNILITGGAGFIGSNFILYWLAQHPRDMVTCVDALTYAGNLSSLAGAMQCERFRFIQADICDANAMQRAFDAAQPDVVINMAAESHVDRSIADPSVFLRTNVLGTGVLLDTCKNNGNVRFHQVSTDEVYGDLGMGHDAQPFTERAPLRPSSPYSASKASADLLVMAYHRTYGLPVTISRCSNNYGPRQYPEKLIPLMIANALAGNPLPVYGDGCNVRDWLHVDDHCRAIDAIVHHGKVGEVYNIGANCEMRNIDIVKRICSELGKPQSLITHVPDRKGHDVRYAIDHTKLTNELGWTPMASFDDGLRQTIRWYMRNKEWWEPLRTE